MQSQSERAAKPRDAESLQVLKSPFHLDPFSSSFLHQSILTNNSTYPMNLTTTPFCISKTI
jgi:hypothetical protein